MKTIRNIFIFFCLLTIAHCSFAQYDPSKINKKAFQLYNQAIQRAEDGNFTSAVGLLLQAIETDKNYVDAYLSLAKAYNEIKNYKNSVDYYEKAFALDTNYTIDYKLLYSDNLAGLGEFEKALNAVNELLTKKPPKNSTSFQKALDRKKRYEFAVDYEKNHPNKMYVFAPKNMGSAINTSESEYFPSLTIDGNELVFTRKLNGRNEDFFYSHKKSTGEWDVAKEIEGNLNTPMSEGAQNISQDGQWLLFTGCNFQTG